MAFVPEPTNLTILSFHRRWGHQHRRHHPRLWRPRRHLRIGGADIIRGGYGDDILIGGAGGDTLDGGDDTDTASYYSSASGVIANLASGTGSSGDALGDRYIWIENLIGSRHNDVLIGDNNNNAFQALHGADASKGAAATTPSGEATAPTTFRRQQQRPPPRWRGADHIDGGAGTDTASYSRFHVGRRRQPHGRHGNGGTAQGDELVRIENLTGSSRRLPSRRRQR